MVKTADVSEEFVAPLFMINSEVECRRNLYHLAPMWKAVGAAINMERRDIFLYQSFNLRKF